MIELIEVNIIAKKMKEIMLNNYINCLYIYPVSRYYIKGFTGMKYLNNIEYNKDNNYIKYNITGKIIDIYTHGLFIFFKINLNDNYIILMNNFINSNFILKKPSFPSFSFEIIDDLNKKSHIYFEDLKNKSQFKCLGSISEYKLAIENIGMDYLNSKVNLNFFKEKINNHRIKDITLTDFLINQKWLSGLKEYLVSEIIFETNLYYKRILGTLSDEEIKILYNSIQKILNIIYNEDGIKYNILPDGSFGKYEPKIYRKTQLEDGRIVNVENNKYKIYWCYPV